MPKPRKRGYGRALNNLSQQLGSALGAALISTFVATATTHDLTRHGSAAVVGATVHGFTVSYWWAAGVFWEGRRNLQYRDPRRHAPALRGRKPNPSARLSTY